MKRCRHCGVLTRDSEELCKNCKEDEANELDEEFLTNSLSFKDRLKIIWNGLEFICNLVIALIGILGLFFGF